MEDKTGKYVPIYLDWLEVTQDLTAEEKGNLIDAVVAYASGIEYEHLLTGGCKIAFRFLKGQVDRNRDISRKRSMAASNKTEQTETNGNKPEQTATNPPKEKEKEKEEDKEKENKKEKRFSPPTVDEVETYCRERNNGIDAQHFVDYYTRGNWILKNGRKMADWKAAVRTWESNGFSKGKIKTVPAQQYTQRDYSSEQEDAMRRMIAGVGFNAG